MVTKSAAFMFGYLLAKEAGLRMPWAAGRLLAPHARTMMQFISRLRRGGQQLSGLGDNRSANESRYAAKAGIRHIRGLFGMARRGTSSGGPIFQARTGANAMRHLHKSVNKLPDQIGYAWGLRTRYLRHSKN